MALTPEQQKSLRKERFNCKMGILASLLLLAIIAGAISVKLGNPAFGSRGPFFLSLTIGTVWLVLLGRSWWTYFYIGTDLKSETVHSIAGPVALELVSRPGFISTKAYRVQCAGYDFQVSRGAYLGLIHGLPYRIYYSPCANVFLGAEALELPSTKSLKPITTPVENNQIKVEPLLSREKEILELIAQGLSNQEIADRLYLSVNTVKMYASQIYRKLGVRRRTEAVNRAKQANLLSDR